MPPTNISRRPLLSLSSPNTQHDHESEPESEDQYSFPLSPPPRLSVSSHSSMHISHTPFSPPLTPPTLTPSTLCDLNTRSFPCTPSTPVYSPISDQDIDDPFDASYARQSPRNHKSELNQYTPHIMSAQLLSPLSPQVSTGPRPIPGALAQFKRRPNLTESAKSDRILSTCGFIATDAHLYSAHFPPGHVLNVDFSREYAPGAEIGVGGFGFVVTVTHRLREQEVAVKFIERRKVPPWGWCKDPVLGQVPTEIMLLRTLRHPGIIKFLGFFQDETYLYLVQELHGSPWRQKALVHTNDLHQKGLSAPINLDSAQSPEVHCYRKNPLKTASFQIETSQSPIPQFPFSTSTSNSPSTFPSPVSDAQSSTPQAGSRPNMERRFSHDLFECIEEHKRLSESQARYIFAQVVDVIRYLDSIGIAHRDIKDENVLIDRAFRVKVIDFGSASCVDSHDHGPRPWYRQFRGTIAYAPAEIFRGVKTHQAAPADVWALGILLSCLICGRRPFATAEDAAEGRFRLYRCKVRAKGETPLYAQTRDTVSAECWDLLKRCLDPDPNTRAHISEVEAHPWLDGALETV